MPPENSAPQLPSNSDSLPPIGTNQQSSIPSQPIENQQQTPPPKTFPTKKLLIGIAALLIVVGLAGGGIFLYQKSTNKDSLKNESSTQTQPTPNTLVDSNNPVAIQNTKQEALVTLPNVNLSSCLKWKDPNMFPEQIGEFYGGPYELTDASSAGFYYKQKFEKFTPLQEKGNPVLVVGLYTINTERDFANDLRKYELLETKEEAKKQGIALEVLQVGNTKLSSISKKIDEKSFDENNQPVTITGISAVISTALPELKADFTFSYGDSNSLSTVESVSSKSKTLFNDWITKVCQPK